MKKLTKIMFTVLRAILILVPGAVFAPWASAQTSPLFWVLSAIAVELLWLILFGLVTVALAERRTRRNIKITMVESSSED